MDQFTLLRKVTGTEMFKVSPFMGQNKIDLDDAICDILDYAQT